MVGFKFMRPLQFPLTRRAGCSLRCCAAIAMALAMAACVEAPPPRPVVVTPPPPQRVFVYPAQGQSPQQTDRDRYECHVWAVQQTGVDPSREPGVRVYVQPAAPPPGANTAGGAVTGALLGSIIAGPWHSGEGFILGAATGAVIGSTVDANQQAQARQSQQQLNQAAAAAGQRADAYRRALGSCLEGRGYTVS